MRYVLFIISFIFLLLGCTKDGMDGRAFLSYSWTSGVYYWTDSNPRIPNVVIRNQDYEVSPGTYSCYYEWYDGTGTTYYWWRFSYTVTINPGGEKTLFSDGEDGSDKFFHIYLSSNGPSLSGFGKVDAENKDDIELMKQSPKDLSKYKMSEKFFEVVKQGQYTITLEYQRVFENK